jgi:hypothetical protein
MPRVLLLLLLTLGALPACSTAVNRNTALKEAVTDYVNCVRWGHIERAAAHVPGTQREAFIRHKRVAQAQMQVHEYEVRAVDYVLGADRARVVVYALWSRPSDPVTHPEMQEQAWRWQENHWELTAQKAIQAATEQPVEPGDAL